MKKRLGLGLGLLAVCTMVACNDSSDSVTTPSWGNGQQQGTANNGQINEDSLRQAMLDSINNALNQLSSASVDLFSSASNFLQSSSSGLVLNSSSSQIAGLSSSQLGLSSSSSTPPVTQSSSSKVAPKSSATVPKSSATAKGFVLGLWDGTAGDVQVPTGDETGGYWYSYTDDGDGGKSEIVWGDGTVSADDDKTDLIADCGGVCVSFTLDQGSNENAPYVAIGFNYSKVASKSDDVSAAGGICVTYVSTVKLDVQIGSSDDDANFGWNNPYVSLPIATAAKTLDFEWGDFSQDAGWGVKTTGAKAAKIAAKFSIRYKGDDGDSGEFTIKKFGPLGACK